MLFPGDYRISIEVINVLGRVASKSNWVNFIVLDENEPFFFENGFELSEKYNSRSVPAVLSDSGTFTFEIYGKNIFFPDTQFTLVPIKDNKLTESDLYTSYGLNRKEVSLVALNRDSEKNLVTVSCLSNELESGYYNLVAKNPSGDVDSIKILVLKEVPPVINSETYPYDNRLNVPAVYLDKSAKSRFLVKGFDITPQSEFSLIPLKKTPDGKYFPFSSQMKKEPVLLELDSVKSVSKVNEVTLAFKADFEKMYTGFYTLQVRTPAQETVSQTYLFIMNEVEKKLPKIDSVQTEVLKDGKTLLLLTGKNLLKEGSCCLIKPFSSGVESQQENLSLSSSEDEKSVAFKTNTAITPNVCYALLFETEDGSNTVYFSIDEKGKIKTKKYDSKNIDDDFLPPSVSEASSVSKESTFNSSLWKFNFKGTLGLSGGLVSGTSNLFSSLSKYSWFVQLDYRAITFGYFGFSVNTNFFPASKNLSLGTDLEFIFPIPKLQKYLTLIAASGVGIQNYWVLPSEIYIPFKIGLNICKYGRIEYSLNWFGLGKSYSYFEDSYRIGAEYKF